MYIDILKDTSLFRTVFLLIIARCILSGGKKLLFLVSFLCLSLFFSLCKLSDLRLAYLADDVVPCIGKQRQARARALGVRFVLRLRESRVIAGSDLAGGLQLRFFAARRGASTVP